MSDLLARINEKAGELFSTIERVKKHPDDMMITVNKKVLLEYLAMSLRYCELRAKEEKQKD